MERNADSDESTRNTSQREQTNVRERLLPDSPSDIAYSLFGVLSIVKNQNTFAKRAREMEKKRKAEEKRNRRKERKVAELVLPQGMSDEETLARTPIENSSADDD